jgi:hypothetical protein
MISFPSTSDGRFCISMRPRHSTASRITKTKLRKIVIRQYRMNIVISNEVIGGKEEEREEKDRYERRDDRNK